jgi:hypothetical protein
MDLARLEEAKKQPEGINNESLLSIEPIFKGIKCMKHFLLYYIVFLFLFSQNIFSQFSFNFSTMAYYDDNILRSKNKSSTFLSSTSLGTAFNMEQDKSLLKLSYNANLSYFGNLPDKNYNEHAFLTDYTLLLDSQETGLNLGGGYSFRSDKEIYNIYDERNLGLYLNFKYDFSDYNSSMAGYSLNSIKYPNLSQLSYMEHILNFSSNFSFQTKTAYTIEANIGFKKYSEKITTIYIPADTMTHGHGIGNGNGYGPHFNWENESNSSGGGITSQLSNDLTSQILISNRIAQSIFEDLGVQFTYSWRYNLKDNNRFIYAGHLFSPDDNIFDDHYGYEGHEFNLGFTQLLPLGMILKADGEYLIKNYTNKYNSEMDIYSPLVDRNDKKFILTLNLKKNITFENSIFNPIKLSLYYIYLNNESTVDYYKYTSNSLFINLSTTINF